MISPFILVDKLIIPQIFQFVNFFWKKFYFFCGNLLGLYIEEWVLHHYKNHYNIIISICQPFFEIYFFRMSEFLLRYYKNHYTIFIPFCQPFFEIYFLQVKNKA